MSIIIRKFNRATSLPMMLIALKKFGEVSCSSDQKCRIRHCASRLLIDCGEIDSTATACDKLTSPCHSGIYVQPAEKMCKWQLMCKAGRAGNRHALNCVAPHRNAL